MSTAGISRRQWFALGALGLGALAVGRYLRESRPLGRDVSDVIDVAAMQAAPGFPDEGPAKAGLIMLVFSDYACGVCRQVEPWWRSVVREAGDVKVVHRDWPILGAQSLRAAQIALAAHEQRRYREVHDALMRSPGLEEPALRAAVEAAGADWTRLHRDLGSGIRAINAKLARTAQDAQRLGFRGTPGFLIGPLRIEGGASERQFADAIDRARAGARVDGLSAA